MNLVPFIHHLELYHYRNHHHWQIQIPEDAPSLVALTGPNGAGKTNILEAISTLVPGRGLRGASASVCLMRGDDAPNTWTISVSAIGGTGPFQAGISHDRADKKQIRLNGRNVTMRALGACWQMIWLTPVHDRLFAEGGTERRRFLDRLVFSLDAAHGTVCSQYEKILRERNRVLRDHPHEQSWLSGLELRLAETGVAMTRARLHTIQSLNTLPVVQDIFPAVELALNGGLEQKLTEHHDEAGVIDWMRDMLARNRRQDQQAGNSQLGPHRSDWRARHLGRQIDAADGSTGEQKAVLLAVMLNHAQLMRDRMGHPPLLLLDEATAHLDAIRRKGLCQLLTAQKGQVWMTGTDIDALAGIDAPVHRITL